MRLSNPGIGNLDRTLNRLARTLASSGFLGRVAGQGGGDPRMQVLMAAYATAVGAATAAVGAFAVAMKTATRVAQEFGSARTLTGGTGAQIARLTSLGIPAGQIPGLAGALHQALTRDPYAMGEGARRGLRAIPGPYGTLNQAQNLDAAVRVLKNITDGEERLRTARMLHLDALLPLLDVDRRLTKAMEADAEVRERIYTRETTTAANTLAGAWQRMLQLWDDVIAAFGKGAFEFISEGLIAIGDALRTVAETMNQNQQLPRLLGAIVGSIALVGAKIIEVFGTVIQFVSRNLSVVLGTLGAALGALSNPGNPMAGAARGMQTGLAYGKAIQDALDKSIPAWTSAADRHARAMETHARALEAGMYGAGERARSAVGSGMQGFYLERNVEALSRTFGAFGL